MVPQNQNPISPQLADAVIRLFLIIPKLWSDKFKVKSPADLLEEKKKQPEFIDWLQKAKLQLAGKKLKRVIEWSFANTSGQKSRKKAKMDSHKYIKTKNTSAISRFEIKRL